VVSFSFPLETKSCLQVSLRTVAPGHILGRERKRGIREKKKENKRREQRRENHEGKERTGVMEGFSVLTLDREMAPLFKPIARRYLVGEKIEKGLFQVGKKKGERGERERKGPYDPWEEGPKSSAVTLSSSVVVKRAFFDPAAKAAVSQSLI
jgi:hypothetical protein